LEPASLALAAAPAPLPTAPTPLLGSSPAIAAIRRTIAQVARTNLTVLLLGESGTGKEVAARLLAAHSGREAGMAKINCAAIPQELWESELFGYEAGAFTGANRPKSGRFELAGGGTLLLDEISEMPLPQQAKLLQVLQDGEFSRLGGQRTRSADVRVMAATNVDLQAAVHAGAFRRDLFYRLNVIAIHLPPLRERRGDLALLTDFFLDKYTRQYRCPAAPLSAALQRRFEGHGWPGNVRELENLIKRYVILGSEDAVLEELLAPAAAEASAAAPAAVEPASPAPALPLVEIGRRAAWQAERQAILQALAATHWNRRRAAHQLGISYKGLQNKLRALLAEG